MFTHETVERELAGTEDMIKDYDQIMLECMLIDDQDLLADIISKRIELAGIKGKLEYMLTLC